ncbi:hypothetical protein SCFA_2820003 [anaerobic digester metagenome]|uniref:Uncharacterized protein n=1 Tax=anaerobic digester metagenome TaxID=1263854 RepID=A0A485LZZ4_9ZZZZ
MIDSAVRNCRLIILLCKEYSGNRNNQHKRKQYLLGLTQHLTPPVFISLSIPGVSAGLKPFQPAI